MVKCDECGRRIERPTLIDGVRYCGACVLDLGQEAEPVKKRLETEWARFARPPRGQHGRSH